MAIADRFEVRQEREMAERIGAEEARLEIRFELMRQQGRIFARLLGPADRFRNSFEPVVEYEPQDDVFADRLAYRLERHGGPIRQLELEDLDRRNGKPTRRGHARADVGGHGLLPNLIVA